MPKAKKLLLVTSSYPAAGSSERSFVHPELLELVAAGFEVTLMPVHPVDQVDAALPAGVHVSKELAASYRRALSLIAIFALFLRREFWLELIERPRLFFRLRFWKDSFRAVISARIFRQFKGQFDLFYTYWFSGETTGMCFAGVSPLFTRAHGYDIYVERKENGGWIPYRRFDLSHIEKVIVLSSRASHYLHDLYGLDRGRTLVSPLGVEDQDIAPFDQRSLADNIVFFSCAYPAKVKRLPLICQFVSEFARVNNHLKVRWVHIGAQLEDLLAGESENELPKNLHIDALGAKSNSYVNGFFSSNEISFFVNLSEMEGLPVSIMEAMAFGVPVIATDVGCVGDLLGDGGGILVPPSIAVTELVRLVADLVGDSDRYVKMRFSARKSQQLKFNSQKNHMELAAFFRNL